MPNEKTDDVPYFEDSFQDVADTMDKCHQMIQKITAAQKSLKLKERKSVSVSLTEEQLEFLQHCVNMELCSAVGFDDDDEDDDWDEDGDFDEDEDDLI